jgi:anti-sigma B factor antagonist
MLRSSGPRHADRVRRLIAAAPAATTTALDAAIHADFDQVVVAPRGELDLDTAPILDADLRAARDLGFKTIVVDLRGLSFIDSAGVSLLLEWAANAARRGHAFRLIPGADRVQLVFRLTGVLELFGLEPYRRTA